MCSMNWSMPAFYCLLFFALIFFLNKFSNRNKRMYDESLQKQQEMMTRQKESVELLREIRDLLINNTRA